MQFILTGFTHDLGYRVFAFDRLAEDRTRTKCTVRADLALIRRYGIQIQDLPLLCRGLLDRSDERPEMPSLTFTVWRYCGILRTRYSKPGCWS